MRRLRPCLVLVGLALGAGCGGGQDATEKQLGEIRSDLVKLRADNAALSQRLDALEIRGGGLKGYSPGAASGAPASDRPALDVVRMTPPEEDPGADAPRPVIKSTGKGGVVEEPARGGGDSSAQRDYEQALELHRAGRHDKAIEAFSTFLTRHPGHANADNAVYWRGESYLAKGEHRRAVEQFEAVVADHPKGNKAPEALLKLVTTYTRLGDTAKAEQAKKRLLSNYPTSEAAKRLAAGSTAKP